MPDIEDILFDLAGWRITHDTALARIRERLGSAVQRAEEDPINILRALVNSRPGNDGPYIDACEFLKRHDMNSLP